MLWGEHKWTEIAEIDKDKVVVLPLGSLEQHGPHLPLLTDTLLVSAVAERTRERLDDRFLWLPTLWIGCSEHHRFMPGTVSLPSDTYVAVLEAVIEGFIADGFHRILLLNGHGGNITPGETALYNVNQRHARPDLWIALATYWLTAVKGIDTVRNRMETPGLTHACEYETSMILSLRPELVDLDKAVGTTRPFDSEWYCPTGPLASRVRVARTFKQMTVSGAMGDPTHATADKGEMLLDAIVPEIGGFLDDFAGWPALGD